MHPAKATQLKFKYVTANVHHALVSRRTCATPSTTAMHCKTGFISKGISFLFTCVISERDDDAQELLCILQATHT